MKTMLLLGLLLISSCLFGYDVKIHVVDDQNRVLPGANVTIDFIGYVQGSGKAYHGLSDINGNFSASGSAEHSVFIVAQKDGYYEARVDRLPKDRDIEMDVVIPRIMEPIPLYAIRANPSVPVQNEWVGYDFEKSDWVAPFGAGKIADIRFKFKNQFLGWKFDEDGMAHIRATNRDISDETIRNLYGKWDAELDISFPGRKEGLSEETHFLNYSHLKLPHKAPVEGYTPVWHYETKNYSPPTSRDKVGFFLRTRVRLDKDGNIISANYAKLMGDIHLAHTGVLRFTYYFNPTPNDRNLEFDPKRNLFPRDHPGTNNLSP